MPPHRLWWALVQHRLEEARFFLPRDLQGAIQFCVEGHQVFHFIIDGHKTLALNGACPSSSTQVEMDDSAVAQLLFEPGSKTPAFRVSGDHSLYQRFFSSLESADQPQSWLQARVGRARK